MARKSKLPLTFSRRRTSLHRSCQNMHLREWCSPLAPKTVINLGAHPDASDKEGGRYRDYFPGAEFKALDQRPEPHPDYVEGDLMVPQRHLGTYDLVIAMSIIEHIDRPWVAAPNISALIAPGGHLFVAMPWFYPVHEGADFGDHWRATPSGLRFLFDDLEEVRTEPYPSALLAVSDRKRYWRDPNATAVGASSLFRKPA